MQDAEDYQPLGENSLRFYWPSHWVCSCDLGPASVKFHLVAFGKFARLQPLQCRFSSITSALKWLLGCIFVSHLGERGENQGRPRGWRQGQQEKEKAQAVVPAWWSCVSLNRFACLQASGQRRLPHLQTAKHVAGAGHRHTLVPLCLRALYAHK